MRKCFCGASMPNKIPSKERPHYCAACGLKHTSSESSEVVQVRHEDQMPGKKHWPKWALILKRLRKEGDTGVGDTAQRIAAKVGGEAYKRLTKKLGMPCGCSSRQADWNNRYKYDNKE